MRGLQGVAYAAWGKRIERNYPLNHNRNYNGKSLDAQVIKQATEGRERDIYIHVCGISAEALDGKHHGCPHPNCPNGPGKDRFRCRIELDGMPLHCNQDFSEKNSDVIAAVQWMRNCTFPEALQLIADYLGINPNGDNAASQPKEKKPSFDRNNIVAEYHYTDAVGELVYKVLRDVRKNFNQCRPDPNNPGKWIWNLQYVKRVPYGLPMLLDESRCNVYIVEGEKDADNLNQLFYDCGKSSCVATTSAGGSNSASKWPGFIDEYNLADRRVFVVPDNDAPGLTFGRAICKAFRNADCNSVKMVSLPVKDISDLIELRRSEGKQPDEIFQEIETLCQQAEPVTDATVTQWNADANTPKANTDDKDNIITRPRLINMSKVEAKPIDWLWPNKFIRGAMSLISGQQSIGKSSFLRYMTAVLTNGWNWCDGTPAPKCSVLFFKGEDDVASVCKPQLAAQGADLSKVCVLDVIETLQGGEITDEMEVTVKDIDYIKQAIIETGEETGLPVGMVVLDPFSDYLGNIKEDKNAEVRKGTLLLRRLCNEMNISLIGVEHHTKSLPAGAAMNQVMGSAAKTTMARAAWQVHHDFRNPGSGKLLFVPSEKGNQLINPKAVCYQIVPPDGRIDIFEWDLSINAKDCQNEQMRQAMENTKNRNGNGTRLTDAKSWLQEFLSDGRKPVGNEKLLRVGTVRYESAQAGHAWKTIRDAFDSLGVISKPDCSVYFWSLPNLPELTDETQEMVAQTPNGQPLEGQPFSLETDGMEPQPVVCDNKTSEVAQKVAYGCPYTQCLGNLGQPDDSEQKQLNNVLNSNLCEATPETDKKGGPRVKAQRRPKPEGKPQPEPETGVTPCDKQQEFF